MDGWMDVYPGNADDESMREEDLSFSRVSRSSSSSLCCKDLFFLFVRQTTGDEEERRKKKEKKEDDDALPLFILAIKVSPSLDT
jgi:hypothetical protein